MDIKSKFVPIKNSNSGFLLNTSVRMHDLKESSDENLNECEAENTETASTSCPGKTLSPDELKPLKIPLRRTSSDLAPTTSENAEKNTENREIVKPKLNTKLQNFANDTKQFLRRRRSKNVKPYPEIKAKEEEKMPKDGEKTQEKTPPVEEVGQEAIGLSGSSPDLSPAPSPVEEPPVAPVSRKRAFFYLFFRFWKEICLVFLLFVTFFSPLPSFLCGLLWGVYLSSLVFRLILWLYIPMDDQPEVQFEQWSNAPEITEEDLLKVDNIVYKGWLNVLRVSYDPRKYHINSARSVLVRLDRDVLRLSIPKVNIMKHAFWNETKIEPTFVSQEMYSIAGAVVSLRPKGLAKRRWWSRKYPICVTFARDAAIGGTRHSQSDTPLASSASGCQDNDDDDDDRQSTDESGDESGEEELPPDGLSTVSTSSLNSLPMQVELECEAAKKLLRKKKRKSIYFFARSSREKEQWFHQLRKAAGQHAYRSGALNLRRAVSDTETDKRELNQLALDWILYTSLQKQFMQSMENLVPKIVEAKEAFLIDLALEMWKPTNRVTAEISANKENITWANALAARVFLDFSKDKNWIQRVKNRIERKMETIHLPYFIETLRLAKLEPGSNTPRITSVYEPQVNEWGLWVDVNVEYSGGIHLMLETKLNLMKLKTDVGGASERKRKEETHSRYSDEELPESPESSADDEPPMLHFLKKDHEKQQESPKESTGKKILHFVDKITQSKYFQDATENKYVKKLMQGVSDTPLILMVDVVYVEGTLAINIPTPPSDRIWYGFRCPPKVILRARPKVGDRSLNLTHVTDWIENKLCLLLEKFLVIPNMDDMSIPIMSGSPLFHTMNK